MKREALASAVAALVFIAPAIAAAQNACSRSYESGQIKQAKGDLASARRDFLLCTKACEAAFADDCRNWIKEIDPVLAHVEALVSPSNARLTVDGIPESAGTIAVNPGKHVIEAIEPDHYPARMEIDLAQGSQRSIVLELKPLPKGRVVLRRGSVTPLGPDPVPIVLLTSSGLLLATGAGLAIAALFDTRSQQGDCGAEESCVATTDAAWACSASDGSSCDRERVIGLYAAAGAAAGAGLALGIAGVTAISLAGRDRDDFAAVRAFPLFAGVGLLLELRQ